MDALVMRTSAVTGIPRALAAGLPRWRCWAAKHTDAVSKSRAHAGNTVADSDDNVKDNHDAARDSPRGVATAVVHMPKGSALQQVKSLDERAHYLYSKHPLAYTNFPVEKLEWRVTAGFKGDPTPELFFGDTNLPSFSHLTPWAIVLSSAIGLRGTIGRKASRSSERIGPADAHQEVTIGAGPLIPGGPGNEAMMGYIDWLRQIEHKLVDHIMDKIEHYALVRDSLKPEERADGTMLRAGLLRRLVPSARAHKGDQTRPEVNDLRVFMRSKLFVSPRGLVDWSKMEYASWLDREVGEQHKLVRIDVPLFDNNGNLIELAERRLDPMDVVSVQTKISGHIYARPDGTVGLGLMRKLGTVVRLRPGLYTANSLRRMGVVRQIADLHD